MKMDIVAIELTFAGRLSVSVADIASTLAQSLLPIGPVGLSHGEDEGLIHFVLPKAQVTLGCSAASEAGAPRRLYVSAVARNGQDDSFGLDIARRIARHLGQLHGAIDQIWHDISRPLDRVAIAALGERTDAAARSSVTDVALARLIQGKTAAQTALPARKTRTPRYGISDVARLGFDVGRIAETAVEPIRVANIPNAAG